MSKVVDIASATKEQREAAWAGEPMQVEDAEGPQVADLERAAPTFADAYGAADLTKGADRSLVSIAELPGWPGSIPPGHGWGGELNRILGGGLCPGYVLAVGAASAGAGKTAFLMQLADGLMLRTAEIVASNRGEPLTPVLVLSEMGADALTWRTLARWTDYDSRIFRSGRSATQVVPGLAAAEAAAAFNKAREMLSGPMGAARRYMRTVAAGSRSGPELVASAAAIVRQWREQLAQETEREVWPVVVFDPLQRWQDPHKSEVEGLNELVEAVHAAGARDGWITLITSDTNKASATGAASEGDRDKKQTGTAAFRGSYKLLHLVDAALVLERSKDTQQPTVSACVVKNRWGADSLSVAYRWNPTRARFFPEPKDSAAQPPADTAAPRSGGGVLGDLE